MDILLTLQELLRDVFDDNNLIITPDTSSADIEEWDSLTHISIIAGITDIYKIKFDISEISATNTVSDMINLIKKKTGNA